MPGLDPRVVASGFAKNQEKYAASKQGGGGCSYGENICKILSYKGRESVNRGRSQSCLLTTSCFGLAYYYVAKMKSSYSIFTNCR